MNREQKCLVQDVLDGLRQNFSVAERIKNEMSHRVNHLAHTDAEETELELLEQATADLCSSIVALENLPRPRG